MERCGFEIMFEGMNIHSFLVSSSYNFWRGPFVFQMYRELTELIKKLSSSFSFSVWSKWWKSLELRAWILV